MPSAVPGRIILTDLRLRIHTLKFAVVNRVAAGLLGVFVQLCDMMSKSDDQAAIIEATKRWLVSCVIGLNLCPFARAVHKADRARYFVSTATMAAELLNDLQAELRFLEGVSPDEVETTLLIYPYFLDEFLDFNRFLKKADRLLDSLELGGVIQIANFHPEFQFADLSSSDVCNYTNRSPYPILHLLREVSVQRAVQSMVDTDEIYRRNLETMQKLGLEGWRALTGGSRSQNEWGG